MAKRAQDSDSEASDIRPRAKKRARPSTASAGPSRSTRNSRAAADDDDGDFAQERNAQREQVPESDFEDEEGDADGAELEEMIRRQVLNSSQRETTVAQAGVVSKVEPQLNFIVGHNGSGKSAFLTAITVALGGKATSTGRGTGLKELVRNEAGVTKAVIKLTLLNRGPDAYRHNVFGDKINITRTLVKEGSGNAYVLSDVNGKRVAGSKTELSAICDHFNIQVDNPINILSQDAARQFLAASTAAEKYHHFLKGTLLLQLLEDYDRLRVVQKELDATVRKQREAFKDLQMDLKEAVTRWKAVESAIASADQLERKKNMLAWSWVVAAEAEFAKIILKEDAETSRNAPLKELIEKANRVLAEADAQLAEIEAQIKDNEEQDVANAEAQNALTARVKANFAQLKQIKADSIKMNQDAAEARATVEQYDKDIQEIEAKNRADNDGTRDKLLEELEGLRRDCTRADEDRVASAASINAATNDEIRLGQELDTVSNSIARERNEIARHQESLQEANGQASNHFFGYGRGVEAVVQDIKKERKWHGKTPVGPLGTYLKLKDKRWSTVLETAIGLALNSFIVTDKRDRSRLQQLFHQRGLKGCTIFQINFDANFDIGAGEPRDDRLLTIYRVLNFENDLVRQALVNVQSIEKVILVESQREGDDIMFRKPQNVLRCWTIQGQQVGGRAGTYRTQNVAQYRGPPRLMEDKTEYIKSLKATVEQHEAALQEHNAESALLKKRLQDATKAREQAEGDRSRANRKRTTLQNQMSKVQEEITRLQPTDMAAIIQMRQDKLANIDALAHQYAELQSRQGPISAENKSLVEQRDALKAAIAEKEAARLARNRALDVALKEKLQATRNREYYSAAYQETSGKLETIRTQLAQLQQKIEAAEAKAKEVWEDRDSLGPIPAHPLKLENEIKNQTKALRTADARRGMTVDEVKEQLKRASDNRDKANKDVTEMVKLLNALKLSINLRVDRWDFFRRYIAMRARMQFLMYTSLRGYEGKLKFNHEKKRLDISVKTEENSQATRKDARSLSGGEKSFSTVAFLLTLWESVNCPIRGLDEFDVFQDSVNRNTSIRMLMEAARTTSNKQHILITPQAINIVGPDVRVHKLDDPDRGQGTLSFGS